MTIRIRKIVKLLGGVLTILALSFLASRLVQNWTRVAETAREFSTETLSAFAIVSCLYAILLLGKGLGWSLLIRIGASTKPSILQLVRIHGTTQILKYLPGNVFHYLGRQYEGYRAGLTQSNIAGSSLSEALLNLTAASLICVTFLPAWINKDISFDLPTETWSAHIAMGAGALGLLIATLWLFKTTRTVLRSLASRLFSLNALCALVLYVLFFLLSAFAFTTLCGYTLTADSQPSLLIVLGVYPLAWVAGYVTPGAPGGIGIRESLIVAGLAPYTGEAPALVAAITFRIASFMGELLYFLIAKFFLESSSSQTN